MDSLISRFSRHLDQKKEEHAPLDTDGAHPQEHLYEKEWRDTYRAIKDPELRRALCKFDMYKDAILHANGRGLDDRQLLLEKMIKIMSAYKDTEASKLMQQGAINLLYKDLPHPPSAYLSLPSTVPRKISDEEQAREQARTYAFRTADGYNTNILNPTMGQARSPYARSVPAINLSPQAALPDAGLVFDTLLKRDEYEPHPGGISALFFAFADLVIHSIFNTDHFDGTLNNTSSYLDLSVLYGNSEQDVNAVRKKDGTGKLLDDVFADPRLLFMPPASCALLILLNRNHNYIAQRILDINENGNYQNPPPADEKARRDQDDEIFHRSRLVNCGYFMKIILGDYVGAILGLVRDGSDWRLDPLSSYRGLDHDLVPTGQGNVVSIEFNLLYRWHATLSERDTKWTTDMLKGIFDADDAKDFDFKNVTPDTFKMAAHKYLIPSKPVQEWEFNNLKRGADGRFKDEDLAKILLDATEARASAFKARGIPEALRVIEVMAINQSRNWGVCSLNEFRKFLGLRPYKGFSEWNKNPDIHKAAEALYKDIDNLELHVGLQAEEPKEAGPGAGLCPGYTISRAILADAVALTRGDRFMTVDFTPHNLTAWGYQDCQYDTKDGSYGGMLTKLLFRTLPDYYPIGSAYAHFPFMEPEFMQESLRKVDPSAVPKYTWKRPRSLSSTVTVDALNEVQHVLNDRDAYVSASDGRLFEAVKPTLMKKSDTLKGENKSRRLSDAASAKLISGVAELSKHIFKKPDTRVVSYFAGKTKDLIKDKSFSSNGGNVAYVDVVKDVINLLPVYWLSEEVAGFPLKTGERLKGRLYDFITYERFAEIASYVYLSFEPQDDWRLREESQRHSEEFIHCVEEAITEKRHSRRLSTVMELFQGADNKQNHTDFLIQLWSQFGKGKSIHHHEFAAQLVAAVVPTAALYSQAVATVVNYYLDDSQQAAREAIIKLTASKEPSAKDEVMKYVYEALRLDPPVAGVYRTAAKDDILSGVRVTPGQRVFASVADAGLDASAFGPEPSVASYQRPLSDYSFTNFGVDGFLTPEFLSATVPSVLAAIFDHKNLQRGPEQSGRFTRFVETFHNVQRTQYLTHKGLVSQYPDSLIIQFAQ